MTNNLMDYIIIVNNEGEEVKFYYKVICEPSKPKLPKKKKEEIISQICKK